MSHTVDEALAELRSIAAELDTLADDDPRRADLEARREALRAAARRAADEARHPVALRRELEALERRLAELNREQIKPALVEHMRWINDASAYARAINARIARSSEDDRDAIEARIAQLRAVVGREPGEGDDQPDGSAS